METLTALEPELMKRLMGCLEEMPAGQRGDLTGRSLGLIRFLDEDAKEWEEHKRALVLVSFQFRLRALARLRDHPEFGAWTIRAQRAGDSDILHEVMIETAAVEPLLDVDNGGSFDPRSFLRHALERVEAQGRA
jgi:hypothetical protein